ncbi:hypothetical protein SARC_12938 [Sphaeroforma arctica JP610]|uniref:Transmembrane 9 superfamily member n=1 Tax=Sphaeroforma arctica JP610 TaxID=667725 RepID=A0A0L0FCM9_9EUKA|nr:hypothetical protein SARC_12938 [Sphaeroforma arctica JP610]KNC74520.1 hypothetical protein SARC_12938 [Sphaeroforma arctica JP610]|eukprot:XP_014148422.1 hypothetical protein SARC_12938 [Sphaeroforma arctica JP610]
MRRLSRAYFYPLLHITGALANTRVLPHRRGQTLSTIIFIFAGTSVVGGFIGGALYLQFGGQSWIRQMLVQTCFFPGVVCAVNLYINFVAITYNSSRAIPAGTVSQRVRPIFPISHVLYSPSLTHSSRVVKTSDSHPHVPVLTASYPLQVKICAIVIFMILPLTLGGAILGRNTTGVIGWPCRVNPVPRPIPENQLTEPHRYTGDTNVRRCHSVRMDMHSAEIYGYTEALIHTPSTTKLQLRLTTPYCPLPACFTYPLPTSQWYMDPVVISLIGGVLPFGSIFIEMYFVFTSFWAYKIYYVYGFMLLVFCILTVVTICVNIVCIYFLLNSEDYRW